MASLLVEIKDTQDKFHQLYVEAAEKKTRKPMTRLKKNVVEE